MNRFAAPWDRQLRLGSAVVSAVLGSAAAGLLVAGLALSGTSRELLFPFLFAPVALLAALLLAWLLAPRGFALEGAALAVERPIGRLRLPYGTIRAVGPLPEGIAGAVRLAGNGGLFGYHGRYWSRPLGAFRLYATRRTGLVRVETIDDVFVLSPAEPERFVEALLARSPRARLEAGAGASARGRLRPRRALRALGFALLGALVLVGGIFGAVWGIAPTGAAVGEDAVRVERRWAAPVELPLAGVRSVEPLPSQRGLRWWRTNGTAMGAVRYGRFASSALGPFRLYAWRQGPYVLLETDAGRVVLTPDDPERFVSELRSRLRAR